MATPKKATQVKFRLNPDELAVWQQKATERNLSLPKFSKQVVAQTIQQGKLKQPKIAQPQAVELAKQLAKIGGNVNQIAKWCNTHPNVTNSLEVQAMQSALTSVQKELKAIWQQLR